MEPTSYNAERQGTSGQGAQWIFGTDKFSDEDHARIQEALNTALSWDQINSRPGGGGKKVPYLAGHTVIENANKVFGFAGWDSSILHLSLDYVSAQLLTHPKEYTIVKTLRKRRRNGARRKVVCSLPTPVCARSVSVSILHRPPSV
ncbi:unnamed protein product [Ectocarpus sp. CCAP 1310/34]|nr:unnamed protein product [Ectocarpus sp. CCAP 1310/34]